KSGFEDHADMNFVNIMKLIIQQLMQQPPPMRQPLIQRLPMQQAIGIPVINTGIVNPSQSIAATGDIDNM
ncbi:20502_t:CDS:2, partial [Entrophospora sp. SA101]